MKNITFLWMLCLAIYFIMQHDAIKAMNTETHVLCPYNGCSKHYASTSSLNKHISRKHLNEQRYACTFCHSCFNDNSSLNRHINSIHTHTIEYQCNFCPKIFYDPTNYTRHIETHTDERFPCIVCDKDFKTRQNLNTHKSRSQTHYKNMQALLILRCDRCQQSFDDQKSYLQHKAIHANQLLQCLVCNIEFHTSWNLKQHEALSKVHKSNAEKIRLLKSPYAPLDPLFPLNLQPNIEPNID